MRARIDISEVEARTKIRAKYLRAIENEEWDLLPGTVFVKSFLKTYSDYLGLDSRMLVDEFKRRYERLSDHDARPIATLSRERERAARGPRGPRIPAWLVIILILCCVGVALYFLGRRSTAKQATSPPPGTTTTNAHKHRPGHRHTATTTTPTTRTQTVRPPTKPVTARVQITPTSAVWICVEDAAGKPVFPAATFDVGEKVPVASGSVLLLTLGNAAADLKINGRHFPLSASSTAIGLKVTPTRVSTLPATAEPTCT